MPTFKLTGYAVFTNWMDRSAPERSVHFKDEIVSSKTKRAAITKAVRTAGGRIGVSPQAPFKYKDTLKVEEILPDPPEVTGGFTRTNKHGQTEVMTPFGWRVQDQ